MLTEHRTATSDRYIVVVLPGPPAPFRENFAHEGWLVETFVHTRASLDVWWDKDLDRRSCALLRMCCESEIVADAAGVAAEIRAEARRRLAVGPGRLSEDELAQRRYGLSDLLEDLEGCERPDELAYIAAMLLQGVAELALVAAGRWSGNGKALGRALNEAEPGLAGRLFAAHRAAVAEGDISLLRDVTLDVLGRVGGPLLVGFRATEGEVGGA